jgi:peptide/nickel transport system permease protein
MILFFRAAARLLWRDKVTSLCLLLAVVIVALGVAAPWLAPTDPADNDLSVALRPPGGEFLLGTDEQGRSLVTRVLYGLRLTLLVGVIPVVAGGGLGALLGFLAAFYRRIDGLVMRCMDVLLSFPAILFGLAIAAIAGPGVPAVILALSIATVPLTARIARGAASVEMARDYIEAGRAVGLANGRLIFRHLAPNCVAPLLVFATLRFGQVILLGAVFSFIGLGAQPPTAELGAMAAQGRNFLFFAPHVAVVPCAALFIVALVFNVLGDGFRDLLDPRLRV